jgi:hypothetical protein
MRFRDEECWSRRSAATRQASQSQPGGGERQKLPATQRAFFNFGFAQPFVDVGKPRKFLLGKLMEFRRVREIVQAAPDGFLIRNRNLRNDG